MCEWLERSAHSSASLAGMSRCVVRSGGTIRDTDKHFANRQTTLRSIRGSVYRSGAGVEFGKVLNSVIQKQVLVV